jgi:hypothetical protein
VGVVEVPPSRTLSPKVFETGWIGPDFGLDDPAQIWLMSSRQKSPAFVTGAFILLCFYFNKTHKTNPPTFEKNYHPCYVAVGGLFTDLGA